MPPMKQASPQAEQEEEEAIGTAVPEPSFGWLPDPAAQIRSSVGGPAAPVADAPPAPHIGSNRAAEHRSRAAGGDGDAPTQLAGRMQPQAAQLRRGFLDKPLKRNAPAAIDAGADTGTVTLAAQPAASAEDAQPTATGHVSEMRLDAVGNGSAAPVAGDVPPPHMAPRSALGPESARRNVFRQLQPLCSALLPLRADAARLVPALRALEGALRTADPDGLQAWPMFHPRPSAHCTMS